MPEQDEVVVPFPLNLPQGVPMPQKVDRADFVDKIKPEQIVEMLRQKLLGKEFDGTNWVQIESLKKYSLTERGAWEISNLMLGAGSINVSISKLSDHQINSRLRNLIKEVMMILLTNWRSYGIKSAGQFYYVKSLVFSNALAVLSQAGGGSIQELFKTTVNESRVVSTSEKKEPGRLKSIIGMR